MAYTVFARKYRPQTFADTAGQDAIARTLRNAVAQGRVAHAYLFAGPRGTGKTSMARILAKALNCASPRDGEPCNACPACVDVTLGRNFDVDEFDAASNRKVEDAEALIQRVRAPRVRPDTKLRVFIVDEVHMMTTHAFNALLKTLEEPPPHVKFLFCTTEPEALPDTILSRCQRFDLRRIGREAVVLRLEKICTEEGITASQGALRVLVRRARGGMRDAQMLLDQAVSLCGLAIDEHALERALGVMPRDRVLELLDGVAGGDVPGVLRSLASAFEDGTDASELCGEVLRLARDLMAVAAGGEKGAADLLDEPETAGELAPLAERLGLERTVHVLGQVAELERRIQAARDDRVLVELCFVRLARAADLVPLGEALERLARVESGGVEPPRAAARSARGPEERRRSGAAPVMTPASPAPSPPVAEPPAPSRPVTAGVAAAAPPGPVAPLTLEAARAAYDRARAALASEAPALAAALEEVPALRIERGALVLGFARDFDRSRIFERKDALARLEHAVEVAYGARLPLTGAVSPAGGGAPEPGAKVASDPRRRARTEVLDDPDVQRVLKHARGGEVVWFEDGRSGATREDAG